MRQKLARVIVEHQPKPIPINMEEALWIADALLDRFDVREKDESTKEDESTAAH